MRRLSLVSLSLLLSIALLGQAQQLGLPLSPEVLKFAVIGDSGTGGSAQYQIAQQLAKFHERYPFEFTIMLGDNLYGNEKAKDFTNKFEKPYKIVLDAGVKFYAALGNHDEPAIQTAYKPFNMNGKRFYTFKPKDGVRFFALDSNYMDKEQLEWFENELKNSGSDWKILFFHHPLYSSGERHGSDIELRALLEPLMIKYGVDVVFSGHEHLYERLKPQNNINYFIVGASAKLRAGGIATTTMTAKGYDQDYTFMLVGIAGDEMYFQTITRSGATIDSGTFRRAERKQQPWQGNLP